MKAFKTMLKTEFKLSLRGMDMIIFSIGLPLVVALILGIIYGDKPAFDGADFTFMEQSTGAVAAIGICASGVMGLPIVLSDYRHKKILKRYRVTPVSPGLLMAVQVVINFIYSLASLAVVCAVSFLFFGISFKGSVVGFLGSFLLVTVSIFSIGMMIAAISKDIKTSNVLCSVFYFPMLIFSGATLPYEVMPTALQKIADFMPLTQGIKLLKGTFIGLQLDNILTPIIVMSVLAVVCVFLSIKFFRWE
jgi:ABC-2 type transport system permease protein